MSVSESIRETSSEGSAVRPPPSTTRVDAAHVVTSDVPASVSDPAARPAELSTAIVIQQVRSQAAQLAAHLQRQQSSADHRESELNARLAAMENQIRGARLWLTERQTELSARQADLDRREQSLAAREAEAASRPQTRRAADGPGRGTDAREAELDRREAEVEALAARLAGDLDSARSSEEVQRALRAVEARSENLERAEQLLASEQAQLARQNQLLAQERISFAETVAADRRKLADDQQRAAAERDRTQRALKRQSDELAARQAALERMRSDVARSQQEVLEVRLATEELWARLCGSMAPAALTQSMAQIRLKLAEEFRLTRTEMAEQKAEVQSLAIRLGEQQERLASQREALQDWASARQRDLEKQAGLLVARQQQVDRERATLDEKSEQWERERFTLQQEIRRLLRRTGSSEGPAG